MTNTFYEKIKQQNIFILIFLLKALGTDPKPYIKIIIIERTYENMLEGDQILTLRLYNSSPLA